MFAQKLIFGHPKTIFQKSLIALSENGQKVYSPFLQFLEKMFTPVSGAKRRGLTNLRQCEYLLWKIPYPLSKQKINIKN